MANVHFGVEISSDEKHFTPFIQIESRRASQPSVAFAFTFTCDRAFSDKDIAEHFCHAVYEVLTKSSDHKNVKFNLGGVPMGEMGEQ